MADESPLPQILDPVFVQQNLDDDDDDGTQTNIQQLEGVVCYVGTVPELSTSIIGADDTAQSAVSILQQRIWVGVRLTGSFVGQGTNDGTVITGLSKQQQDDDDDDEPEMKRYFDCPKNCGLFVLPSQVQVRNLTKLEALRLRRELASSSSASSNSSAMGAPVGTTTTSAAATATISSNTPLSGRITPPRESLVMGRAPATGTTITSSTTNSSSSAVTAKSRLEELRLRREALKATVKHGESLTTPSNTTTTIASNPTSSTGVTLNSTASTLSLEPSTTKLSTTLETEEWKMRCDQLNQQLVTKDDEIKTLRNDMVAIKLENSNHKVRVVEIQKSLDDATAKILNDQTTSSTVAAVPTHITQSIELLQKQNMQLESENATMKDQQIETQQEFTHIRSQLHDSNHAREEALMELTRARAEVTSYQNQLRAITDQNDQRGTSDAIHYKERAKLSADVSALKRKIEQLEKEKMELEASVEDITLDKEQLQEEKEALDEKYEDLKLDAETAQMEVEELRIELDDAKATAGRVMGVADTLTVAAMAGAGSPSKQQTSGSDGDAAEVIQSLQTQSARLREALIRLREQSALEKMELTRQLRSAEKIAEISTTAQRHVEELTALNHNLNEQVNELKDMVEQSAAFEIMVEDLSDRVMLLEEQNVALNAVLREMEEAAELTAEMEEVQADELKAISRDLEGRDTIIRNLEEAIKMQRRREDDFRRTVGNYKSTVDTLRQEKQSLLELQQGDEGEKNNLVASSQKALSRAARLVSEAADMRKREAEAVVNRIEHITYKHMSNRLESMLPQNVISTELSAVRGELIASKVVCKAAQTLSGIAASFRKNIRPPLPDVSINEEDVVSSGRMDLKLSDDVRQEVQTIMHEVEFARAISEISSELMRLIAAGQWPDLLSAETSTELGTIIGHAIPELDQMLGTVLKTLKEEGSLTIEQSDIGSLQLTVRSTMEALRADIEQDDKLLRSSWNPPGRELFRDVSVAKFFCLGTAATLSVVVDSSSTIGSTGADLNSLYNMVEHCSSLATNSCLQLANLDVMDVNLVGFLSTFCSDLMTESISLMRCVRDLVTSGGGDINVCHDTARNTLRLFGKLSLELRSKNLNPSELETYHSLSPEADDPWRGIVSLVRSVRSIDGDNEDVNFLIRAKLIEQHLGDAVDNVPKLELATEKIVSLEKSLSSRFKEIAIQNARLSELEKLIAKSSATPVGRGTTFDFRTSDEYGSLQEENRVLTEAMDVLQREVETYENEIRALKDFKSPKRGNVTSRTPVRSSNLGSGLTSNHRGPADDSHSTFTLEATLFRPALQQALHEAARWKAVATGAAMVDLTPLPASPLETYAGGRSISSDDSIRLSSTIAKCRIEKASMLLVDLTNRNKTPRLQLREMKAQSAAISNRLETIMLQCRGRIQ